MYCTPQILKPGYGPGEVEHAKSQSHYITRIFEHPMGT